MDHAEMYARLGQVTSKSLYQHLSEARALPAPGDQPFALGMLTEPCLYGGAWSFTFDVVLPNDQGSVMFMIGQVGSGFDHEAVTLPLPPMDFEDTSRNKFPPEHKAAYYSLLDAVMREITHRGFAHDSDRDFLINQDYYPSTAIGVAVMNPAIVTRALATACQALLQDQPFAFSIVLSLDIDDAAYRGEQEALIIRRDRIVEDWNVERLWRELPGRFTW
jgi:hypothetical protein